MVIRCMYLLCFVPHVAALNNYYYLNNSYSDCLKV